MSMSKSENGNSSQQLVLVQRTNPTDHASNEFKPPQNLQDLLKLSTNLHSDSREEPPEEEMSDERADFLRRALNQFTMDYVTQLRRLVTILSEINVTPSDIVKKNLQDYINTLEELADHVCCLNQAQSLYEINGLDVIVPLFSHEETALRWRAIDVVLECCKNHPFCQKLTTQDYVFGKLMELSANDSDTKTRSKAISAVSAIVRNNPEAIKQFRKYSGVKTIKSTLDTGDTVLITKTLFLIMALCDTDEETKDELVKCGTVQTLLYLLILTENFDREYLVRSLDSITKDHAGAIEICAKSDLNLSLFLTEIVEHSIFMEGCEESRDCAKILFKRVFGDLPGNSESVRKC